MLVHLHFPDKSPVRNLASSVAKQRAEGGRLVHYRRIYTFFTITWARETMRHVPIGESRIIHGIRDSLLTLLLGIWGPTGLITALMVCAQNLRGGIDVTAHFSQGPIDPFRSLPPDPSQSKKDAIAAQWTFVGLGLFVILLMILIFGLPKL